MKRCDAVIRRRSRAVKAEDDGQYAPVATPRELLPTSSTEAPSTHTNHELTKAFDIVY